MTIPTNKRSWYLIDAQDKTLGRLGTLIAEVLKGKNQVSYLPYLDSGNYVIVINAAKIKVTGNKAYQKFYYKHSGKPGNLKKQSFIDLQNSMPQNIIVNAVKGMLPKNLLGKQLIRKLKVYKTSEHPHLAQQPSSLEISL